jgi:hypothetical protein
MSEHGGLTGTWVLTRVSQAYALRLAWLQQSSNDNLGVMPDAKVKVDMWLCVRAWICQTTCGACQAHASCRLGARTLLTLAGKEYLSCSVQFSS